MMALWRLCGQAHIAEHRLSIATDAWSAVQVHSGLESQCFVASGIVDARAGLYQRLVSTTPLLSFPLCRVRALASAARHKLRAARIARRSFSDGALCPALHVRALRDAASGVAGRRASTVSAKVQETMSDLESAFPPPVATKREEEAVGYERASREMDALLSRIEEQVGGSERPHQV